MTELTNWGREQQLAALDAGLAADKEARGAEPPRLYRPAAKPEPMPRSVTSVTLIRGSDIRPEPVDWLWPGWLAAGKLHILAGAPGTGKTTIAMSVAAIFTSGGAWPDGSRAERGSVLIWSGEDDPQDTLVPRLIAAGADMKMVYFVGNVFDHDGRRAFDPARDMDALATSAKSAGNVRLLIVDPVVSAVTGDSHKNTETRRALQPLVDFGIEHGCAVLGISHFSKGSAGRDPVERVCGSIAFGALARIVLAAAKMPDKDGEPEGRVFARAKSNIGPDSGGFRYDLKQIELERHPGLIASTVVWGEPLDGSARELLAEAETERSEDDQEDDNAVDGWLRELLTEEGEATKSDIMKAARACGFSTRTVERAHKRIGAKSKMRGFGKDKTAYWSLSVFAMPAQSRHPKNNGEIGEYGGHGEEAGAIPPFSPCSPGLGDCGEHALMPASPDFEEF